MVATGNSNVSDNPAAMDFIGKFVCDLKSSMNLEVIDGKKLILQSVFNKATAVVIPKTSQSVRIPPVSLHTKKEMISTESDNRYENSFNGKRKIRMKKRKMQKVWRLLQLGERLHC